VAALQGRQLLGSDWAGLAASFGLGDRSGGPGASGAGRVAFTVRQGVDAAELSNVGSVVDVVAETGAVFRLSGLAVGLSGSGITFRSGLDDPASAASTSGSSAQRVPSLKISVAKALKEPYSYVAASFDLKQRKPELSACWTGEAGVDSATVLARVDPVMRAVKLTAAVSTPGPEWRKVLYNEDTNRLEHPEDDGARHTFYFEHEARPRDMLHATRIGAKLDLGRLVNYACDFFYYHLEERVPDFVWSIPLVPQLYYALVGQEDDDQVRHRIHGWTAEVSQVGWCTDGTAAQGPCPCHRQPPAAPALIRVIWQHDSALAVDLCIMCASQPQRGARQPMRLSSSTCTHSRAQPHAAPLCHRIPAAYLPRVAHHPRSRLPRLPVTTPCPRGRW
jgi:hypothetical protein